MWKTGKQEADQNGLLLFKWQNPGFIELFL